MTSGRTMAGHLWQRIAGQLGLGDPDARDQALAERADRVHRFLRGEPVEDIWALDLFPILRDCYDTTLAMVEEGKADSSALRSLRLVLTTIDNTLTFGEGAMERYAQRQLRSLAAAKITQEKDPKTA